MVETKEKNTKKRRDFEIVQQVKYMKYSKEQITHILKTTKAIKDYALIIHDKDVDEKTGKLKEPHYHICIRYTNASSFTNVANLLGVKENYVAPCKSKWVHLLKYLTHSNAKEKYQYSDSEIISNFDVKEYLKKNDEKISSQKFIDDILLKIVSGEIREFNIVDYMNVNDYVRFKSIIDKGFDYRNKKLRNKVERKMECIFITGASGSGKSTFAKKIAREKNMSVYVSSGSNDVLDTYSGQSCVILDDLRPSCLGLSDLLKMLDNNTSSTVASRYKNKILECELIIITTVLSIDTFFKNVFESENEPCIQLQRRCKTKIIVNSDYIRFEKFDDSTNRYEYVFSELNPISQHIKKELNYKTAVNDISNILGRDVTKTMIIEESQLSKKLLATLDNNKDKEGLRGKLKRDKNKPMKGVQKVIENDIEAMNQFE